MRLVSTRSVLACLVLLATLSACTPRLSPLYRDYEVATQEAPIDARIRAALSEAGWTVVPASAPNAIATDERVVADWGLYKVTAELEVVPVGTEHVRLYVHPYRKYIFGNRSKIPFMKGALRSRVLPELNEAFEAEGLHVLGTMQERDDVATND